MRVLPNKEELEHRKFVWKNIQWRMNVHRVTPDGLSGSTGYSTDVIVRGINGEAIPLTHNFLVGCTEAFNLRSNRLRHIEDTPDELSDDELEEMLKPEPKMPPKQGNFWDIE